MRGNRVLAVDDDELILTIIEVMLEVLDLEVSKSTRAQEAMTLLVESKIGGKPFDLLIADLDMPGERGTVLIKAVRELEVQDQVDDGDRLPIILLTAEDPAKIPDLESEDLMRLGIIYMNKASMADHLLNTVRMALDS